MTKKKSVSLRITNEGLLLLDSLTKWFGVSRSAVIEMAIREKARAEGLEVFDESSQENIASLSRSIQGSKNH